MKKLTATILALLFILSSVTAVAAEGKAHRMNEANCEHESECSHPMDGDHDAHIEEAESAAAFADNGIQSEKAPGAEPDAYHTAPNAYNIKKASEESKKLAQTVVEKLVDTTISLSGEEISDLPNKEELIYSMVCSFAPEILKLGDRADGALALLELYEEFAEKAKVYDWNSMKQRRARSFEEPEKYSWKDEDHEGYILWRTPCTIEGLFARYFYEKLDKAQQERFLNTLCFVYNSVTIVVDDYLKNSESYCHAEFFDCGGKALVKDYSFYMNDGRVSFKALPTVEDEDELIRVPNGSITLIGGTQIPTKRATNELSDTAKTKKKNKWQEAYPNNQFVAAATAKYNCHSYAWYSQSTSNSKWIEPIDIEDANIENNPHYIRFTNPQVGYIVVYKAISHGGCVTVEQDWVHSGIVVSLNPLRIRSKWGAGCLWTHGLQDVPQSYKGSGNATVRYYCRLSEHLYSYSYYNTAKHRASCVCGTVILEPHVFLNNTNDCEFCGYHAPYKVDEPPALPRGKFELDLCSSGNSAA